MSNFLVTLFLHLFLERSAEIVLIIFSDILVTAAVICVHLSWCDMDSDISSPYVYGVGLGLKVVERISAFWRFVQNGF